MRVKLLMNQSVNKNSSKDVLLIGLASSLFLLLFSANDLIILPFDVAPKLSVTISLLLVLFLFRKHFNLDCTQNLLRINTVPKKLIAVTIVYFLIQLIRPIIWSQQSSILKIYWAIQFIELLLLIGIIKHSLICKMQTSTQIFLQSLNFVRSIFIALLLYSFLLMMLAISNYSFRFGLFEFSSRASNWIILYIMFPIISIAILKGKIHSYVCAFFMVFMSLITILKVNSRSGIVSFAAFFIILLVLLFFLRQPLRIKIFRTSPFFLGGILLVSNQFSVLKQLISDILITGQIRNLDTGYTEKVDQDRLFHLQTAFEVITRDFFHLIFGFGFRESSYEMAQPLYDVYVEYLPHLDFESELGSRTNVSTFGFSALIVDFGLVGLLLISGLLVHQVIGFPWAKDFIWSIMRLVSILLVLGLLYTANFLASPWFAALILQGNLIDRLYLRWRYNLSDANVN